MDKKSFYGFECEEFLFEDTIGIIVSPGSNSNGKIVFKTEYWVNFPNLK